MYKVVAEQRRKRLVTSLAEISNISLQRVKREVMEKGYLCWVF